MTRKLTHQKGFNVDLYGNDEDQSFSYFIDVPGFLPDHAEVDFGALYTADQIKHLDDDGLLEMKAKKRDCLRQSRS